MIELALKLEEQLKSHDWFYEYSDDHRYWSAGLKEKLEIADTMKLMKEAGYGDLAETMLNKHKPKVQNHDSNNRSN